MSEKQPKLRKNLIWSFLFVLIAAASVWAVISQNKSFSIGQYIRFLRQCRPVWIAAAFLSMLTFIWFSAEAIRVLLRAFDAPRSPLQGLSYAAADLYFSAITPSATGGQPAAGLFMMRDGVSGVTATVILLANLAMYTISIVLIGLVCLILRPGTFLRFSGFSRFLIIIGAVIQISLATFYCVMLWKEKILDRLINKLLKLILKIKWIKHPEALEQRVLGALSRYAKSAELIRGKQKVLWKNLLYNMTLRTAQICVTMFCYLAQGGQGSAAFDLFALQSNVVVGSTFIPIPGAMGVTDFLMLDGFQSIMSKQNASNLELLSRTTSFYVCIFLCGTIVLIRTITMRLREKTPETHD